MSVRKQACGCSSSKVGILWALLSLDTWMGNEAIVAVSSLAFGLLLDVVERRVKGKKKKK